MALREQATLGELRDDLARRCGYGAQVGNLGELDATFRSFLRDSQLQLWWQYDWPILKRDLVRATGIGQQEYDYPSDCEPARIESVWVQVSGHWQELTEGRIHNDLPVDLTSTEFDPHDWEDRVHLPDAAHAGVPCSYERQRQLLLYPVADQAYPLRIRYQRYPEAFSNDADRCTLYDELVFLNALAKAKAHYRHEDAKIYQDEVAAMLARLRLHAHGNQRYFIGGGGYRQSVHAAQFMGTG